MSETCSECAGTGEIDCPDCGGDGLGGYDVIGDDNAGYDMVAAYQCDTCGGSGNGPCEVCDGTGEIEDE